MFYTPVDDVDKIEWIYGLLAAATAHQSYADEILQCFSVRNAALENLISGNHAKWHEERKTS